LAGNLPALLPRRAKGIFVKISKALRFFLQDFRTPPPNSIAVKFKNV
jgi:hypothetical protein